MQEIIITEVTNKQMIVEDELSLSLKTGLTLEPYQHMTIQELIDFIE